MTGLRQDIQFARSADGTRIAYASSGRGYPVVKAAHWLGHLEFDWETPVWQPWNRELSECFRLIRLDSRGCGLSDRDVARISVDALAEDLAAVISATNLERCALLGQSQGGAACIAYAARNPDRVSHLVLCGAFARGALKRNPTAEQRDAVEAMLRLIELGWGEPNSAFLQMFTSQFFPDATLEQMKSFNAIQRNATSPRTAARLARAFYEMDVSELLPRVRSPTLVMHSSGDCRIPFDEGRRVAAMIPGARFLPLESRNHLPLEGEPAFQRLVEAVTEFLPASPPAVPAGFAELSERERQIVDLIARGLDNAQIAARLELAEKTVRNHITHIFDKLAVENRAQAIVRAREAGFGR